MAKRPIALEDLEVALHRLETSPYCIAIGLPGRRSVKQLLRLRDWSNDRARLARVIGSTLGTDRDEVDTIAEVMERALVEVDVSAESERTSDEDAPARLNAERNLLQDEDWPPKPPTPKRPPPSVWLIALQWAALCGLAAILIAGLYWLIKPPTPVLPPATKPAEVQKKVSDEQILERCPDRPDEVVARGRYWVPLTDEQPWSPRLNPYPSLVLAVASAMGFLWLFAVVRQKTRILGRTRQDKSSIVIPPPPPSPMPDLFTRHEEERIAAGAGRWLSDQPSKRIDVARSVLRAAQSVEPCDPVFRRKRVERALWVWSDERVPEPLHQTVVDQLVNILHDHRAPMRMLRSRRLDRPEECTDDLRQDLRRQWQPQDLDDLEAEAAGAAVMLITHREALFLKSGQPRPAVAEVLERLARWPRAVLVDVSRSEDVARLAERTSMPYACPEDLPRWLERAISRQQSTAPPPEIRIWRQAHEALNIDLTVQGRISLLQALSKDERFKNQLASVRPLHADQAKERTHAPLPPELTTAARNWWWQQKAQALPAQDHNHPRWHLERHLYDLQTRVQTEAPIDDVLSDLRTQPFTVSEQDALRAAMPWPESTSVQKSSKKSQTVITALHCDRTHLPMSSQSRWGLFMLAGLCFGAAIMTIEKFRDAAKPPIVGLEMVVIPGGLFCMGSAKEKRESFINDSDFVQIEPDEAERRRYFEDEQLHLVRLSDFAIARTEVTVGQLKAWLTETGTTARSRQTNPREPIHSVTWQQARDFCRNYGLDLPTEAQWEYAAKGGKQETFGFGDDPTQLKD
ncbi:MAG: formylglycine-generating enzyme family protein, partial [Myxococcota bacterium]